MAKFLLLIAFALTLTMPAPLFAQKESSKKAEVIAKEEPNTMTGLIGESSHKDKVIELAKEWVRNKGFLSVHVRRTNRTNWGIGFSYSYDGTPATFNRIIDDLRKQFDAKGGQPETTKNDVSGVTIWIK